MAIPSVKSVTLLILVGVTILGVAPAARSAGWGATGHGRITFSAATADPFDVPPEVARLMALGAIAPDMFEFMNPAAHAQTPDPFDAQGRLTAATPEEYRALQLRGFRDAVAWREFYLNAAERALREGDRERSAFLLGYALHNVQDYATHQGMPNALHSLLDHLGISPDDSVVNLVNAYRLTVQLLRRFRKDVGEGPWQKFVAPGADGGGLGKAVAGWDPTEGVLESKHIGYIDDAKELPSKDPDAGVFDPGTKVQLYVRHLMTDNKNRMKQLLDVPRPAGSPAAPVFPESVADFVKDIKDKVWDYPRSYKVLSKLPPDQVDMLFGVDWEALDKEPSLFQPAEQVGGADGQPRYGWLVGDKDGRLSPHEAADLAAHPNQYARAGGRTYYLVPRGGASAPPRSVTTNRQASPILDLLRQGNPDQATPPATDPAGPGAQAGEKGPRVVTEDKGPKQDEAVGGVRLAYESGTILKALRSKASAETERRLVALAVRLDEEKDFARRQELFEEFTRDAKARLRSALELRTLVGLTTVSLKAVVAEAAKYGDRWDRLPPELRHPGNLARVHGFVRLPEQQDILLLGTTDPEAPPLELDDLVVAARVVWKGRGVPGCSLDPDPDDIAAGRAGPQKVRLLGVPRDCGFARTMLDADYEMKRIIFGTVPAEAPGFTSLKDLIRRSPDLAAEMKSGARFWFQPVSPQPGEILASPDGQVYLFSGGLQVLTEEVMFTREGAVGLGKVFRGDREAAESFTRHFTAVAGRKPIFRKLQTLSDLVLLASLWKELGLRSDLLDRLCALPYRTAAVPDSYAGIKEEILAGRFWLVGGVDMKLSAGPRSWLVLEDAEVTAVRKAARGLADSGGPARALDGLTLRVPATTADPRRQEAVLALRGAVSGGNLKDALQAADRLVAADPWDGEALILRAEVQLRRADYGLARLDAARARAVAPGDRAVAGAAADVLFRCGWMEGKPEAALREVERALRFDPDSAGGQVARADALLLLDRPDEARKALLKAVELDPTSALACARLAVLELVAGRTLDAKPWVARAQALDPKLPEVRLAAARWELATVRPDRAERIAREVWEQEGAGPTARLQALAILAAVSASREKWDDVDGYVGQMDRLSAGSPEVLAAAAEIAATWGERQRAARYLEKAERLSPNHPLVQKLRAKLGK